MAEWLRHLTGNEKVRVRFPVGANFSLHTLDYSNTRQAPLSVQPYVVNLHQASFEKASFRSESHSDYGHPSDHGIQPETPQQRCGGTCLETTLLSLSLCRERVQNREVDICRDWGRPDMAAWDQAP